MPSYRDILITVLLRIISHNIFRINISIHIYSKCCRSNWNSIIFWVFIIISFFNRFYFIVKPMNVSVSDNESVKMRPKTSSLYR